MATAPPGPPQRYGFGSFELRPDNRRLLKDGATISLRARSICWPGRTFEGRHGTMPARGQRGPLNVAAYLIYSSYRREREKQFHKGWAQALNRQHVPTRADDAFDQAWREGHAMTLEETVRYALDSCRARTT